MADKENYISISSIRNDKEEKIENLQRKIDNLEKDLFKSQCNNKKLEYQLKKNQEIITKYGKVSHFLTVVEYKQHLNSFFSAFRIQDRMGKSNKKSINGKLRKLLDYSRMAKPFNTGFLHDSI